MITNSNSLMGVILIPAYNRDYSTESEVISAWLNHHQFILCKPMHKFNKKLVTIKLMSIGEFVEFRFNKLSQSTIFTLVEEIKYEQKEA